MAAKKSKGYRDTLNLPRTSFPMRARLVEREPKQRKQWRKEDIYGRIRNKRTGEKSFVLHDGPPYANGDIHMGHVINKVLKDFVIKYKTMRGYDAPYVPGWDCHGLPIESKVTAELGEQARQMSKLEIRKRCMKYAGKYVKLQSRQFQDLGIFGDFENPYLTFKPQYEAGILEVFSDLVEKGLVHKQLKPIHWSVGCETALAEAELEYKDISSPSIYVNFPARQESIKKLIELGLVNEQEAAKAKVCFMIWTTTPWTLAANLAVAVNPHLEYKALKYEKAGRKFVSILAGDRLQAVVQAGGLKEGRYIISDKAVIGSELKGLTYKHPFVEENPTDKEAWKVITAEFVTTEDGTGVVHTAPGHGVEDYVAGQEANLAIYSPVKANGCYDDSVPEWLRGRNVLEVDPVVNDRLREDGFMYAQGQAIHSYPHCWRSKMPVIFRATEQWFISVDRNLPGTDKSLRDMGLEGIRNVRWIPSWGRKRIEGMLQTRPDWCISRQRSWGLPIPAFVNSEGKTLMTRESVRAVAKTIGEKGSNCWFSYSPRELLGENFELPEEFEWDDLEKEENIFDVWFESGCSWYNVIAKAGGSVPVDLYLEGSDQHRGWFQLSLLPALGSIGQPPFKSVLTHGFTVDEKGMKQSKSLGNYVNAQDEIARYGSDILRLWVSSVNYREDMRCTDELIGKTQDAYRKIRNTLRYLFGNLKDFNPEKDSVAYEDMVKIDRWAIQQLQKLKFEVMSAYEEYSFHRVFSSIYRFCTVEMSNIYMDVLKDRMYCDPADSLSRRSGQTVMNEILGSVVRMVAPILSHTAEEAWALMEHKPEDVQSVHLAHMPEVDPAIDFESEQPKWNKLIRVRDKTMRVLEELRQEKQISSNEEAKVKIRCDAETAEILNDFGAGQFASLCIVSEVEIQSGADEFKVEAQKSENDKCRRCWNYRPSVGQDSENPDLCQRCAEVVRGFSLE